jgi:hypothetical protein
VNACGRFRAQIETARIVDLGGSELYRLGWVDMVFSAASHRIKVSRSNRPRADIT